MASTSTIAGFPLPAGNANNATVVASPEGRGPQFWAGASSAVLDDDGSIVIAYRVRESGTDHNVIARTTDGTDLEPIATVAPAQLGA